MPSDRRTEAVSRRNPTKPAPADQPSDDFQQIPGIGAATERRLHGAGILTYQDLAARSPEQIAASLAGMAGLSPARIASQNWTGRARELAGPPVPPLPSEPDQRYASFHIELLLDVDDSVRRTKVHHHQTDTDDAWPGWDEARLLALLRGHIPPLAARQPADAADQQSSAEPPIRPETAAPSRSQPETISPPVSLPSSCLHIEELGLTGDGLTTDIWTSGEPTSIRFAFRVSRTSARQAAGSLDFTADITARNKFGDNRRWPLGMVQGAIRTDEPFSVDLVGPPLPCGLYRLEANVLIYPANHRPDSEPLQGRRASGPLIQVA
jgi:helix-hairpin-helix protein